MLGALERDSASNALAAGIIVYELARLLGTSVDMIERHYGALLDTARASFVERLDAITMRSKEACET
jgi:hypothetical protein